MRQSKLIIIGSSIVLLNILVGHLFAPVGIMTTPVVIILICTLICNNSTRFESYYKSLLLFGLISVHDIGIKLFSGGMHDLEGLGLIHLFLFVGLIPSFIILVLSILNDKKSSFTIKIISVLLFPMLITIHLLVFQKLWLGRNY